MLQSVMLHATLASGISFSLVVPFDTSGRLGAGSSDTCYNKTMLFEPFFDGIHINDASQKSTRRILEEKKMSPRKSLARLQTADSPPEDVAPQR